MTVLSTFDLLLERVAAGERLTASELAELARTPDILQVGMLADAARRRLHGTRVTYLRVASYPSDQVSADPVPPAAREVRITGSPSSLDAALAVVARAKAAAGDRTVAGFSWADVERLAAADGMPVARALSALRAAGLDAFTGLSIDAVGDAAPILDSLRGAGFEQVRLTIERAPVAQRTALLVHAAELQDRHGCIHAVNPLPIVLHPSRPTTGYDDVKGVAVARLAAPNIPVVQVDWARYGPKLAQVALTFGADDLDAVSSAADTPDGPRRAPLEEVRRNIVAAGFDPVERDGRFNPVS